MKKCLLIVFSLCVVFAGCYVADSDKCDKQVSYENTILSKETIVDSIKNLLGVNDIYFFDCDFSGLNGVEITNVSYNLSVSGTLIYDEENDSYIIDTDEQASISIVANYQIESSHTASFGFSLESSVMRSKMTTNQIVNGEIIGTEIKPTVIYTKGTFSSVTELYYSYATYSGNNSSGTLVISVPDDFYPCNLIPDATSVVCTFSKVNGDIYSSNSSISIYDSPVHIVSHYQSVSDKKNDSTPFIDTLIEYFVANGQYICM